MTVSGDGGGGCGKASNRRGNGREVIWLSEGCGVLMVVQ